MYMTLASILLGVLSILMASIWYKRLRNHNEIFIFLEARYESNQVGRGGEVIRTTLADRTLEGTIAIVLLGSLIPYTFAYLLFISFASVGGSILILFLAVLVVQAPFDVAVSDGLLKWLTTHDPVDFKIGDFAYAKV
ncbi:MAG: hypothetical protein ACW960_07565, partial [Candidatus Thorarchaeota archaeon]